MSGASSGGDGEKPATGSLIQSFVVDFPIVVFGTSDDTSTQQVKEIFAGLSVSAKIWEVDVQPNPDEVRQALSLMFRNMPLPLVFIGRQLIGSLQEVQQLQAAGKLADMCKAAIAAQEADQKAQEERLAYQYDLCVIGGGSGGIALAKEAKRLGQRVLMLDFVDPSPRGTKWGLGGTCVNVGCIPKKLMHQAALLGQSMKDAYRYGWGVQGDLPAEDDPTAVAHSWGAMVGAVGDHIGSLNWNYRKEMREKEVKYINGKGTLIDNHTVEVKRSFGSPEQFTAAHICVAVGGRPRYPDIPGAREYGHTSDDIFSMSSHPGRVLVVGASYVALECAGFMAGLGIDVTCCVRSILLRGFDQDMAERIGQYMEKHGVKFIRPAIPEQVELVEESPRRKLRVRIKHLATDSQPERVSEDTFNTVLFAVGRDPLTKGLGLENAGVKTNAKGFIPVENEQSNVPNIFAIGDVVEGKPELTPVAIQAGQLLAQRLYGRSQIQCDYINVPTTVFTPLEYGCCGYTEDDAIAKFGAQNIQVYTQYLMPLEWTVAKREADACYCKVICNVADLNRVVGLHFLGPNAGEVIQGFSAAMKCGMTKEQLDSTIGIHPTVAESFTTMKLLKGTGPDGPAAGC